MPARAVTSGGLEDAVDGGERPRLRRSLRRQALKIVAIYACAAGAWIAVSDRLLGAVTSDADDVLRLSIIKGIAFVAVTAGVLFAMLRSSFVTIELAERLAQARPQMKVLYLSGYTHDAIVHHRVLEAELAFLEKPVTPEVLLRKVREVLDASA